MVPMVAPGLVSSSAAVAVGISEARHTLAGRNHFRQTKIENLGIAALGDEYVGGLDVAMNDAAFMRGMKSIGNGNCEFNGLFRGERPAGDVSASAPPSIPWQ